MFIDDLQKPSKVDRSSADNFKFNTETEFTPILGLLASNLNEPANKSQGKSKEPTGSGIQDCHHSALLAVLAEEMNIKPEEIHDFEL